MKKLLIALIVGVMTIGIIGCKTPARAESLVLSETIEKLPELKQGVAYSLLDKEVNYLSTFDVLSWKKLNLEAGFSSNDKLVAVISYPLVNLKEDFDVTLPLLDLINCRIGIYGGVGRIGVSSEQNEWDFGVSATILQIKF